MRGSLLLIMLLATSCMDPIGAGPPMPPPPGPPPPRKMNVVDEIDSAWRATEAEEMILNDPRLQERQFDSLTNARNDTLIERMIREKRKSR